MMMKASRAGSLLALAYSKWEQAHPNISVRGNVLKVKGNFYYGSLPVIEAAYHRTIEREGNVVIDFSECHYVDREAIRWLAGARRRQHVELVDRRTGRQDRRQMERRAGEDRKRRAGRRRNRPDRRHRPEF